METHGSEARSYGATLEKYGCAQTLNGSGARVQVAPPSVDAAPAMPWAPPSDHRSCCQAATANEPETLTCGSTSAFGNRVPLSAPAVQAEYGLGPEIATGAARTVLLAMRTAPMASAMAGGIRRT